MKTTFRNDRGATGGPGATGGRGATDGPGAIGGRSREATGPGRGAPVLMVAAVLAVLFLAGATFAQNADDVRVTNHLFAERVIQTADGGFVVQEVIVGFERGMHSFETLTQIVLPQGRHTVEMAIADPKGKELERIKFGALQAERDGWTMSLRGQWRDIQFRESGMHVLVVYRNSQAVARFFLTVE